MKDSTPSLFRGKEEQVTPLAERCRPSTLEEYVGQEHLTAKGRIIHAAVNGSRAFSMILWGDPGTGKTTLAKIIAEGCGMEYHYLSAVSSGVADVRKVIASGERNRTMGRQTLLFLDEIHRFNKAQQDAVLGAVESGDIVLIGATTENPSFSVISPLLSRARVLKLNRLSDENLRSILDKALATDRILEEGNIKLDEGVAENLVQLGNGDARRMLNVLEVAFMLSPEGFVTAKELKDAFENTMIYYDRKGDRHYDTISAFIKSLRGSDPDAALYYMSKMILAGEDPEFIARRMVILASEDIGNASPNALQLAVSTMTAVQSIGMPESELVLAQCAIFLAAAPKSNALCMAISAAKNAALSGDYEIPMHIRNAPTGLMKRMGYGKDYRYPHNYEGNFVDETYLPKELEKLKFYSPTDNGSEKAIKERLMKLWPERFR
ncbi:MAG TPA: replication-associated recombination protein A [Spirochaetota bacterium]|nr:replication-associated recombination protein A [Spirochaetota bacterium]